MHQALFLMLLLTEKLDESLEKVVSYRPYEHGERSMLVFTPTVMNMENGRCEMTFSMVSPDF